MDLGGEGVGGGGELALSDSKTYGRALILQAL